MTKVFSKHHQLDVSVIVVCWNSATYLPRCLYKLSKQTHSGFEVIVVDNGSTDGGTVQLEKKYPGLDLHVKRLSGNLGFAVANNIGACLARGHWLALLNVDAFPEPDWLARLLEAAETIPNAFFASRQIQANAPDLIDGEGDVYHISGLAWRRNYGLLAREQQGIEEVFSPCGAAALYPRQAFLDAGGFDEDYFSYQEDIDLGFRLRLQGLHCFYVPQAVVQHVGSASTGKRSDFAIYYGHRNLVWTYFKNVPMPLFLIFLPVHLLTNFFMVLKFWFTGHGRAIWRAKIDAIKELGSVLKKRKVIQGNRKGTILELYNTMEHNLLAPLCISIQRRKYGK